VNATVALIDGDVAARELEARGLQGAGLAIEQFDCARAFFSATAPPGPRCAVVDAGLPDMTGQQFRAELARRGLDVPTMFLVGEAQVDLAVSLMKSGATDVLVKPVNDAELLRRLRRVVGESSHSKLRP